MTELLYSHGGSVRLSLKLTMYLFSPINFVNKRDISPVSNRITERFNILNPMVPSQLS